MFRFLRNFVVWARYLLSLKVRANRSNIKPNHTPEDVRPDPDIDNSTVNRPFTTEYSESDKTQPLNEKPGNVREVGNEQNLQKGVSDDPNKDRFKGDRNDIESAIVDGSCVQNGSPHPPIESQESKLKQNTSEREVSETPSESDVRERSPSKKELHNTFNRRSRSSKASAPRDIGGRRGGRSSSSTPSIDDEGHSSTIARRPEITCRFNNPWVCELIVSTEQNPDIKAVQQDGHPLEMVDGEYRLLYYGKALSIVYNDGESGQLPLIQDDPFLFKLRENWEGDGRQVGRIGYGHFVVIVPNHWNRKGNPPLAPVGCTDTDYTAHYFKAYKGMLQEEYQGFSEYNLSLHKHAYNLTGTVVFDDSDEGELFIDSTPHLNVLPGVVDARTGEESEFTGRWKGENFKPDKRSLGDVLDGRQGRFFVRVYDSSNKLLDSGEFRYLRDLRAILLNGEAYSPNTILMPTPSGHNPAALVFKDKNGRNIHPAVIGTNKHVRVHPDGTVIVAPHPEGDIVSCFLDFGAEGVNSEIRLPRVWWCMDHNHVDSRTDKWKSKPFSMTQDEFRKHADADVSVRVRLPQRVPSVGIGFGNALDTKYITRDTGSYKEAVFHLSDFKDHSEIDQPQFEDASLNIGFQGNLLTVVKICVDPTPVVHSFASDFTEITIGDTVTLTWSVLSIEPVTVVIEPDIGCVKKSGSLQLPVYESIRFVLKLIADGPDDVTKHLTVKVRPHEDYSGRLLTASQINRQLRNVELASIMAATHFNKLDLQRFFRGEFKTGRSQPTDPTIDDISLFYEDMSDYALCPQKYTRVSMVAKNHRRALSTKRKNKRLLGGK